MQNQRDEYTLTAYPIQAKSIRTLARIVAVGVDAPCPALHRCTSAARYFLPREGVLLSRDVEQLAQPTGERRRVVSATVSVLLSWPRS